MIRRIAAQLLRALAERIEPSSVVNEDDDEIALPQSPLTPESRAMLAKANRKRNGEASAKPLPGSAASRYAAARRLDR